MTLMQMLEQAGYPRGQMYTHESDLYVSQTALTNRVIDEWCKIKNFSRDALVSTFTDQITGARMYDIAFANDAYWCGRLSDEGFPNPDLVVEDVIDAYDKLFSQIT